MTQEPKVQVTHLILLYLLQIKTGYKRNVMLYNMKVILISPIVILPLGKYGTAWTMIIQNICGQIPSMVKVLSTA